MTFSKLNMGQLVKSGGGGVEKGKEKRRGEERWGEEKEEEERRGEKRKWVLIAPLGSSYSGYRASQPELHFG